MVIAESGGNRLAHIGIAMGGRDASRGSGGLVKQFLKKTLQYSGLAKTGHVRKLIEERRHPGWPYCPPDEGDLIYQLANRTPSGRALEIGCATGSTAIYILAGMPHGHLTSIDFAHGDHDRSGEALIARAGYADCHTLIEADSAIALPDLAKAGERYDLIFLDGWKSFDHLWVDIFYCARMLRTGGFMIFDDAKMRSVRKGVSLLKSHYEFSMVDNYGLVGGARLRLWHSLISRQTHAPYLALCKTKELDQTPAGSIFDFWAEF